MVDFTLNPQARTKTIRVCYIRVVVGDSDRLDVGSELWLLHRPRESSECSACRGDEEVGEVTLAEVLLTQQFQELAAQSQVLEGLDVLGGVIDNHLDYF